MLEANPDAALQVYAVWFDMLPGDNRSQWPGEIMSDARVSEYWDESRSTGRWFAESFDFPHGNFAYDVYYLFGRGAIWEDKPPDLASTGYTIVSKRDRLALTLEELLPGISIE